MRSAYEMSIWRRKRRQELLAQGLTWDETIPILGEEELKIVDDERLAEEAKVERQRIRRSKAEPLPIVHQIARRVAAERAYARKTQKELAAALDISSSSVGDIERARRPVTAAELFAIALFLDRPVGSFFPSEEGPAYSGG